MLKISFNESVAAPDCCPFVLAGNDRGEWEFEGHYNECIGAAAFLGYGGENVILIQWSPIGPDSYDFVVVHTICGNPNNVAQKRVELESDMWVQDRRANIDECIAALLAEVCAYDPFEQENKA